MTRNPGRTIVARAGVGMAGGLIFLAFQLAGQFYAGHNPVTQLRRAFWHDQLGYLAIVSNARDSDFTAAEPVTLTGVNHYPRLYYTLVGAIARATGMDAVVAWNVIGLLTQTAAIVTLAVVMSIISRRWWLGLLAPLPFVVGTFAYLSGEEWYTVLQAHAILWGPFGVLFSKNAEAAGLSVGVVALSLLAWAWSSAHHRYTRWIITIAAAAAIGGLSSVQTYSFLTMVFVLVFCTAVAGLLHVRRRAIPVAVTLFLLVTVVIVGPAVADSAGQLPTLIFGLLPAVPGLFLAAVQSRGLVAIAGMVAGLASAPQIASTISGILSGDPFLVYRVASNHDLGVMAWPALVGALPVVVPLAFAATLGIMRRNAFVVAGAVGATAAWVYLALNDLWGANSEPYRFWLDGLLVAGVIAALCGAALAVVRRDQSSQPDALEHVLEPAGLAPPWSAPQKLTAVIGMGLSAVLLIASLPDWLRYSTDQTAQSVWTPNTPREDAIADLARSAFRDDPTSLLAVDPCVDPRTTKVTSASPLAYYYLGMAWPTRAAPIDVINEERAVGILDFEAMDASDTHWLLTDSGCAQDWASAYRGQLEPAGSIEYHMSIDDIVFGQQPGDGAITLWQVRRDR